MHNNDTLSVKRKELEIKRLQHPNIELKFEIKTKFQGMNPHPVFKVANLGHKTTPASFIVTYVDFNRDPTLPDLPYGKIVFYIPYSGLKNTTSFENAYFHNKNKNIVLNFSL